ncbi:MAG TPA: type II toxin-antitoxin system prevent-host-death family antitoxin [Candidatus Tumulicola sp.]|jgi:prevent-host-death family protein
MRRIINLAEAKSKFSEVIDGVVAGESVTITRNGKPVAEIRSLQPLDVNDTIAQIRAIRERVAAYQKERGTGLVAAPGSRPRGLTHEGHRI